MLSTELINTLKIKGSFPTSDDLFSNADFLSLFNHQLKVDIVPLLIRLNEEFFLQYKDFSISLGAKYRIPKRAIGAKIRDLKIHDGGGNVTNLDRLFEEDRGSNKSGYYLTRNSVELTDGFTSGTLRVSYFARPSTIVLPSACAQVLTIDTNLNQVVVASVPATFSTNTIVDFIQNNNPYDLLGMDFSITSVSGTTLAFSSLPDGLEQGDWISLACESPVAMIPEELQPVLIQSALVSALSSKKDKALEFEMQVLMQNKQDAINLLEPRVENNSSKIRSGRLLNHISGGY